MTHPNDIVVGETAQFELLIDGLPLANAPVTVFREAGRWDGRKVEVDLTTDARGRFSLRVGDGGACMTVIRHRMAAPAGSPTPFRSSSTP